MATEFAQKYPAVETFFNATPYAYFEPINPLWRQIQDVLGKQIQKCFLGELTPKEALDVAAEKANKLIAEFNE